MSQEILINALSTHLSNKALTFCFAYANSYLQESRADSTAKVILWSLDYFLEQVSIWKRVLSIISQKKILPSLNMMANLRMPKIIPAFGLMTIFLGDNHKGEIFLASALLDPEFLLLSSIQLEVLKNSQHPLPI